jgi:hypothetical protein
LACHYVEQLWQLIHAGCPHPLTRRNYSIIVFGCEDGTSAALCRDNHRPKFQHRKLFISQAHSMLNEEHRATSHNQLIEADQQEKR